MYEHLFIISPGFISEEVPPILVQLCSRMGNHFTLSCMQFNSICEYSLLGNQSYVTAQREWQPVSQLPHVVFCNEPSHVQNSDSSCTEGLYNRATQILFHGWSTPAYSFSVSSCQLSCQGTCAVLMNWVDFGS